MPIKLPKVIGHRGAKAYAPENTLPSFHAAADMGCEWVEFDVKLSKDGEPIVCHDENLLRVTGVDKNVADLDFAEIQELDAGSHFSMDFTGEKIPHLEDVLEVCISRNLGCNIEIKPCPGRETETTEVVLDLTTRIWPEDGADPLISSFNFDSMVRSVEMMPEWPRALCIGEEYDLNVENWAELAEQLQVSTIHCNGNAATDEQIAAYLATELPILAYTINDPMKAQQLLDMGVAGVFSDNPDLILEELETWH